MLQALVLKNGIAVCNSILQAAYALLLQCSQDVISELVEAPQGWEKVLGVLSLLKLSHLLPLQCAFMLLFVTNNKYIYVFTFILLQDFMKFIN